MERHRERFREIYRLVRSERSVVISSYDTEFACRTDCRCVPLRQLHLEIVEATQILRRVIWESAAYQDLQKFRTVDGGEWPEGVITVTLHDSPIDQCLDRLSLGDI